MSDPRYVAAPAGDRGGRDDQVATGSTSDDTSLAAERSYLGALLWCDAADARQCMALVKDDDLGDPFLRTLHSIIRRMLAEGVPVDATTVPAYARRHALIESPNLRMLSSRIAEMASNAPVGVTVTFHAGIVAEEGIRRRGADECARLARIYLGADIDAVPAAVEQVHAGLVADLARIGGVR